MRKMKGQAATEYLMTYGWALLAIAIVGALLYTQVFKGKTCGPEGAQGFSMVNAVVPTGIFAVDYDPQNDVVSVQVEVENRMDTNVTVTSLEIAGNSVTGLNQLSLEPGEKGTLTGNVTIAGAREGDCYSLVTKIKYDTNNVQGLINTGRLNGRYA